MGSLKRHFKPFLAIIILCHHNEAIIKLVRIGLKPALIRLD